MRPGGGTPQPEGIRIMEKNEVQPPVRVGTAILVLKDDKVLFGKRTGRHANGVWAFPGGWLEFGESFEENARREVLEETGMDICDVRVLTAGNNILKNENSHSVSIFLAAQWKSGEPQACEPNKCGEWRWFAWNDLPQPNFPSTTELIESGFDPFANSERIAI